MTNIIKDIAEETQYEFGTTGRDMFVIDGDLADYGYEMTSDNGVVIWNKETCTFDILYNVEFIKFCDAYLQVVDGELVNIGSAAPEFGANTDPIAKGDNFEAKLGEKAIVDVLVNDSDEDGDTLTITQINGVDMQPGWTTWVDGVGLVTLNADNTLSVEAAFEGDFGFEYTISDGNGGTATATACGTSEASIDPNNNAPVIVDDNFTVVSGETVTVNPIANDSDPDGDALTITQINGIDMQPGWATWVEGTGLVTLTSDGQLQVDLVEFDGTPCFEYTASDGKGGTGTAIVTFEQPSDPVDPVDPADQNVDLSIEKSFENLTKDERQGYDNAAYSYDVVKYTLTVTNNSDTEATGVQVTDIIPENLDVWKDGDDLIENRTGQDWANDFWSRNNLDPYSGSPEYVDSTNGTVTVIESASSEVNNKAALGEIHGVDEGSVVWDLGTPIAPGETVTLEYFGIRDTRWAYQGRDGSEIETHASITAIDQTDTDLSNNEDSIVVRWISPIALDLSGDGEIGVTGETSSIIKDANDEIGATVEFDLDADGELDTIEWFDGSGDGILVDVSKIGTDGSLDGSALFGDEGGKYANGYEKLSGHDANGDGSISGDELGNLGLWVDDGDAVLEDGELQMATDAGVTSVSTNMELEFDAEGRGLMRSEAEVNGETVMTEDVWFTEADTDLLAEIQQVQAEVNTSCAAELA